MGWIPDLEDYLVLIIYDVDQIAAFLDQPELAHLPGEMCEAVQNLPLPSPGRHLRSVA